VLNIFAREAWSRIFEVRSVETDEGWLMGIYADERCYRRFQCSRTLYISTRSGSECLNKGIDSKSGCCDFYLYRLKSTQRPSRVRNGFFRLHWRLQSSVGNSITGVIQPCICGLNTDSLYSNTAYFLGFTRLRIQYNMASRPYYHLVLKWAF
jgi:hypothetical protein